MPRTERVRRLSVSVRRPNEYTSWRPRVDRGIGWSGLVWGALSVTIERAPADRAGQADA